MKLAAVADVNQSRCNEIAPDVPGYQDIHALIAAVKIDGLVILTPSRFHLSDATAAAEAGLPSLVEKPAGLNAQEAEALNHLRPSPWIGFNRRFDPSLAQVKNSLPDHGRMTLELHYRRASWKPFDMEDDALLDLAPHLIDLALWLTGSRVLSVCTTLLYERCAEFNMTLERWQAMISCSTDSYYRESFVFEEAQGQVRSSYKKGGLLAGVVGRLRTKRPNSLVTPLVGQLQAFDGALRGKPNCSPLATSAEALRVMRVIDAVRRSAVDYGRERPL